MRTLGYEQKCSACAIRGRETIALLGIRLANMKHQIFKEIKRIPGRKLKPPQVPRVSNASTVTLDQILRRTLTVREYGKVLVAMGFARC